MMQPDGAGAETGDTAALKSAIKAKDDEIARLNGLIAERDQTIAAQAADIDQLKWLVELKVKESASPVESHGKNGAENMSRPRSTRLQLPAPVVVGDGVEPAVSGQPAKARRK